MQAPLPGALEGLAANYGPQQTRGTQGYSTVTGYPTMALKFLRMLL